MYELNLKSILMLNILKVTLLSLILLIFTGFIWDPRSCITSHANRHLAALIEV